MIEINLVPDVKQELIRAQRVRLSVISAATLFGLVSIGIVVILALLLGAQVVASSLLNNSIEEKSKQLAAVPDVDKTLTIQNQLATIPSIRDNSHITSRIFDVLTTVNNSSSGDKRVQYSNLTVDTVEGTVTVQAQTPSFEGLDAFKKTLEATKFEFATGDSTDKTSVPLASDLSVGEQGYGQDTSGSNVVTFTITFTYPEELLSTASKDGRIVAPQRMNATDSYLGVPRSLFTEKAEAAGGAN